MSDAVTEALDEVGFAVVRGALLGHDFDSLETEFTELMNERIDRWNLSSVETVDRSSLRRGLLGVSRLPGFDPKMLNELDICLPYHPWSVIRLDTPFHVGPALLDLVASEAILDIIESVLGPAITLSPNGHARYKLPSAEGEGTTPWHRDAMTHAPSSSEVRIITCWVPTADVDLDSGCLVVVPGGHRIHQSLEWPLTKEVVTNLDAAATPLPVRKGDLILMDKNLPHASLPNQSNGIRFSLDLRYGPTGAPSDRPWFPSLEVRSSAHAGSIADVDEWRRSWEVTRAVFATSGAVVPGRPEHARAIAETHFEQWEKQWFGADGEAEFPPHNFGSELGRRGGPP